MSRPDLADRLHRAHLAAIEPLLIAARKRLSLRRAGNLVRTTGLMGHGDFLAHNVMKLLFHDVMQWLLARADPATQGLRHLLYGAVEHGNAGLFAWKRSFEFAPLRLGYSETSSSGQTGRRTRL